jgi:hypothetical protein
MRTTHSGKETKRGQSLLFRNSNMGVKDLQANIMQYHTQGMSSLGHVVIEDSAADSQRPQTTSTYARVHSKRLIPT